MRLLNEIAKTIVSATAKKVYSMNQKENEIKAIYTPPVIENGVMVQMGRTRCASFGTTAKCTTGIKWYEDKLIRQN